MKDDIELESYSNKLFFFIDGNELMIKFESNNKAYINNFSLENLISINNYFKQFNSLDECKNKLDRFNIKNKIQIEIVNNIVNLNIIYDEDEDPIKIE